MPALLPLGLDVYRPSLGVGESHLKHELLHPSYALEPVIVKVQLIISSLG